jgi:hypothetical protein
MRIALVLVALAATTAHARPHYDTLYELPGIDIVESINEYTHDKGDGGAVIDDVHIYMTNKDGKPHVFRIKKLELLHGHCGSQKWKERSAIAVKNVEAFAWDESEPSDTGKDKVTVPAVKDMVSVRANFKSMRVYNECDRFAFAIQLEVDGKLTPIELELLIKRNDPKN